MESCRVWYVEIALVCFSSVVISEFTLWHKLPMPLSRGSSCRLMGRMGGASDSFESLKIMSSFLSVFLGGLTVHVDLEVG